jgi:hypothetical protein
MSAALNFAAIASAIDVCDALILDGPDAMTGFVQMSAATNAVEAAPIPAVLTIWLRGEKRDLAGKKSGYLIEWVATVKLDAAGLIDLRDLEQCCRTQGGVGGLAFVDAFLDRMHLAHWSNGYFHVSPIGLATLDNIRRWNKLSAVSGVGAQPRDLRGGFTDV